MFRLFQGLQESAVGKLEELEMLMSLRIRLKILMLLCYVVKKDSEVFFKLLLYQPLLRCSALLCSVLRCSALWRSTRELKVR